MTTLLVWLLRIIVGVVGVVALLLISSYGYQQVASWRERRLYPPPGQLVDVGGYHIQTSQIILQVVQAALVSAVP